MRAYKAVCLDKGEVEISEPPKVIVELSPGEAESIRYYIEKGLDKAFDWDAIHSFRRGLTAVLRDPQVWTVRRPCPTAGLLHP